jgi:hypothetical protein
MAIPINKFQIPFGFLNKNSKIGYIYGGSIGGTYYSTITKLNFSSEVFTQPTSFGTGLYQSTSTQSKIFSYFIGGYNSSLTHSNIVQKISHSSDTTSVGSNYLSNIRLALSGSSDVAGYVFGGNTSSSGYPLTIGKGIFSTETYSYISSTIQSSSYNRGNIQNKTHIYMSFNNGENNAQKLLISTETMSSFSALASGAYRWNSSSSDGTYLTSGIYNGYKLGQSIYYNSSKVNFSTDSVYYFGSNIDLGNSYMSCIFNDGSIYMTGGLNGSTNLTSVYKLLESTETTSSFGTFSYTANYSSAGCSANTLF